MNGSELILKLYDLIPPKDATNVPSIIMILEYVDSNLAHIFRTNQFFTHVHIQCILYQILLAMKYIHSTGIIHNNLKPENVLINDNCSIKISGFHFSQCFRKEIDWMNDDNEEQELDLNSNASEESAMSLHHTNRYDVDMDASSLYHKAPEIILSIKQFMSSAVISPSADIWSIGTIFGELLQMKQSICSRAWQRAPIFGGSYGTVNSGFGPFGTLDSLKIFYQKFNVFQFDHLNTLFVEEHSVTMDLLFRLLTFNVDDRITMDQALKHSFFKEVRDPISETFKSKCSLAFPFEAKQLSNAEIMELFLEEVRH